MAKKKVEILALCFWCGTECGIDEREEEENTRLPQRAMVSYEPCRACSAKFAAGITLFESQRKPFYENQPAVGKDAMIYPSGRWITLPEDAVEAIFNAEIVKELRLDHGKKSNYISADIFAVLYREPREGSATTSH
jgi:hypothetical protein